MNKTTVRFNSYSCIDTYAHSCLKPLSNEQKSCSNNQNSCSKHEIRMLFEHGLYLKNPQERPRFVIMMLCGKTLRHCVYVLLTLTLLAKMTALTFDFAS